MTINKMKPFSKNFHIILVVLLLLATIPMISGCKTYSAIKKKTIKLARDLKVPKVSGEDLKKRIGIAFFENKTIRPDQNLGENFHQLLVDTTRERCPDLLILKPGDAGYPDIFSELPRKLSGVVDNLEVATVGRQLGLNAIVTGSVVDISKNEETRGILWLKDIKKFFQVMIMVEVYDTETAAKLIDESFVHKIDIDEFESETMGTEAKFDITEIKDAMVSIADDMGKRICDAVDKESWKGYVISTSEDTVVLSSGENVGLKPGDILDVYYSGKTIEGAEGRLFFIPGLKTGEIKITAVHPDRAEAVLVSGNAIQAVSSVKQQE